MPRYLIAALLCFTGLCLAETTIPEIEREFDAKVIGVTDGDTIRVLTTSKEEVTIRLEGIDAPEKGQDYSKQSTTALKAAVAGRHVLIQVTGTDKYGRTLAYVIEGETLVNQKMIEKGWAWHFTKYNTEQRFADAEAKAREDQAGLWKDSNPVAPWDYRNPPQTEDTTAAPAEKYWLNTSSNVRHNSSCKHFGTTKRGRYCKSTDGKACGICGG